MLNEEIMKEKAEKSMELEKVQKATDLVNENSIKPLIASCKNTLHTKGKSVLAKEMYETIKMNLPMSKKMPSYRKTEWKSH